MKKQYGFPEFYRLIEQMAEIHSAKNHDYAGESEPDKNFRAAERLGISACDAIAVRMIDKWTRFENFVRNKELKVSDETIDDTLIDLANYALIWVIMKNRTKKE